MTPAGTSNELDVQNKWEENIHTHSVTVSFSPTWSNAIDPIMLVPSGNSLSSSCCCCCCCLHIKNRSDLYSVPSNIRTGSTDANNAFRGHRLTTQKGYIHIVKKSEINKNNPEKSKHMHAIIGK